MPEFQNFSIKQLLQEPQFLMADMADSVSGSISAKISVTASYSWSEPIISNPSSSQTAQQAKPSSSASRKPSDFPPSNSSLFTIASVFLIMGRVFGSDGCVFLTMGRVFLTMGRVFLTMGRVFLTMGRVFLTMGRVFLTM